MRDEIKNNFGNKKTGETSYWLCHLFASKYLTERQFASLHADCEEMIRMLGSTQLTMKTKLQKGQKS